ncbi:MAG: PQQ-dependent sugar dehydrogenase [Bacteroidota bacterium]
MKIQFKQLNKSICSGLILFLFVFGACQSASTESRDSNPSGNHQTAGLTLKEGFSAMVVADNLGRGRHIAVNDNGDIYVSLRQENKDGGVAALRDTTGDGKADIIRYFSEHAGTGIGLYKGYLYVGPDYGVYRYKMTNGQLVPDSEAEAIATGFPDQGQHAVKPFTFDDEGNIYVNVGGPSNACMEETRTKGSPGMDPCPQLERQAGIWRFKAEELNQDQVADGYRYATGIRNAVALDWNHANNTLYVVQHGRDQLHQFFPDIYTEQESADLPAEEFFLVEEGSDFGWPYCYYDQLQDKKVLAPEYGGDGSTTGRCEDKVDPIMAFPGHVAPNDLLFYTGNQFPERYQNGAFIAFHGSWNRGPFEEEGFYVMFVPMKNGLPSGDWEIFADGFAGGGPIENTGDAQYRPCGLAEGPDGSLYVVDSNDGRLWRISYGN